MEKLIKEQFKISGGNRLVGEVKIKAAKNSVLPILACCLLSSDDIIIQNVPNLLDIKNMLTIMRSLGVKIIEANGNLYVNTKNATANGLETKLTGALRSSIFLLGPSVSRFKHARLGLPGGCAIGARPIDIHIDGLKALGVNIKENPLYIDCDATKLAGASVRLKFPSVGATENLMMAAVLARGKTVIYNAAKEPEIVDLANFINTLGGRVFGAGTKTIIVEGVARLYGGIYRPFGDRIAAPTFLAAAAATKGDVSVVGVDHHIMASTLRVFVDSGASVLVGKDYVTLKVDKRLKGVGEIITKPYPSFPTDMQAQIVAMLALSEGTSVIKETIFESRFKYINELVKLGADIRIADSYARVFGVKKLVGTNLKAEDLRGGAALTIAALASEGQSIISDVYHIDRGYESLEESFRGLGGNVERVKSEE